MLPCRYRQQLPRRYRQQLPRQPNDLSEVSEENLWKMADTSCVQLAGLVLPLAVVGFGSQQHILRHALIVAGHFQAQVADIQSSPCIAPASF